MAGRLRIRAFAEADAAAVSELWNEVFAGDPPRNEPSRVIARKLGVQRELFFVVESEGRIVGTAIGGYDGYRGWVYHVGVHPEFRRRGVGRELMGAVEAGLRSLGCPKLNLQVRQRNPDVVRFYESLGFDVEHHISMGKLLE